MSETQTEPQEPQTEGEPTPEPAPDTIEHPEGEPVTAPEEDGADDENEVDGEPIEGPGDEPGEAESAFQAPDGADVEPGVSESRLMSDRERMKRDQALDKERERHANRLGQILGDEAPHLVPCPVCIEAFDGWIFDPGYKQLSTEMALRMKQILGIDDWEDTPQASWAVTCETCNGHGRVKTGSKVEQRETTGCLDCGESGWINLRKRQEANGHAEFEIPTTTGPTVFGTNEPDPRILSLREEGYMIVPPTVLPSGN